MTRNVDKVTKVKLLTVDGWEVTGLVVGDGPLASVVFDREAGLPELVGVDLDKGIWLGEPPVDRVAVLDVFRLMNDARRARRKICDGREVDRSRAPELAALIADQRRDAKRNQLHVTAGMELILGPRKHGPKEARDDDAYEEALHIAGKSRDSADLDAVASDEW